jgi:hypothetical protein
MSESDRTFKILAYNTSWVNDAHNSILHPGLSESASIVGKAMHLAGLLETDAYKQIINYINSIDDITKDLQQQFIDILKGIVKTNSDNTDLTKKVNVLIDRITKKQVLPDNNGYANTPIVINTWNNNTDEGLLQLHQSIQKLPNDGLMWGDLNLSTAITEFKRSLVKPTTIASLSELYEVSKYFLFSAYISSKMYDHLVNSVGKITLPEKYVETPDGKNTLEGLRLSFADKISDYIAEQLKTTDKLKTTDSIIDFVALTEQTIHVPEASKVYSKLHGLQQFDITNENNNYGILRRIAKLNKTGVQIIDITDGTPPPSSGENTPMYTIVYDNVANVELFKAAEGISIIMNNQKYSHNTLLQWNRNVLPVRKRLDTKYSQSSQTSGGTKDNDPINQNDSVYFYSDDLGQIIHDENITNVNVGGEGSKVIVKRTVNGDLVPDMGRPIMLTASKLGTELYIFISVHSVNLYQLRAVDRTNFIRDNNTIKLTDNAKEIYRNIVSVPKTVKELLTENTVTNPNTEAKILVNTICQTICNGIGGFITAAFKNTIATEKLDDITKCYVLLGGDFNDSNHDIFNILTQTGLKFTINEKYTVVFPEVNIEKTCCANADSVTPSTEASTLGPMDYTTLNRILSYPPDFISSEKFGYYGDYALCGLGTISGQETTPPTPPTSENMKIDTPNYCELKDTDGKSMTPVMPSDHLQVITTFTFTFGKKGGKRANNHRRRSRRYKTKKRVHHRKSRVKKTRISRR